MMQKTSEVICLDRHLTMKWSMILHQLVMYFQMVHDKWWVSESVN